jgi:hypothetical protein
MEESNTRSFFSPLTSHFEALQMVRDTSGAFFMIAGLQLLGVMFTGEFLGLVEVGINTVGALCIRRANSRAAAVILLLTASLGLVAILVQLAGGMPALKPTGLNLLFALLGVWAGARATEATFKLRGALSH